MTDIIDCTDAMNQLKQAMKDAPDYAWSWHCNIAMASQDEGMDNEAANRAAARFMKNAFDIDFKDYDPHKD